MTHSLGIKHQSSGTGRDKLVTDNMAFHGLFPRDVSE